MHSAKSSMASHHLANYGVTLAWEWALAGLALLGYSSAQDSAARGSRRASPRPAGSFSSMWSGRALLDFFSHRAGRARGHTPALPSGERTKTNQPARARESRRGRALDRAERLRRNLRRICLSRIFAAAVRARDRPRMGGCAGLGAAFRQRARLRRHRREC